MAVFTQLYAYRISPRASPRPASSVVEVPPPATSAKPEPQLEMDIDISTSPPSVEETLAARRARRQAIMAKYAGLDSNAASPSPGPTSAIEPPHAPPAVSDTVTQPTSATETPVSPWVENGEEDVSQSELCAIVRYQVLTEA